MPEMRTSSEVGEDFSDGEVSKMPIASLQRLGALVCDTRYPMPVTVSLSTHKIYFLEYVSANVDVNAKRIAVLLHDPEAHVVRMRFREDWTTFKDDLDILELLAEDLYAKLQEFGADELIEWMTSTLSNTIRMTEGEEISTSDPDAVVESMFIASVLE